MIVYRPEPQFLTVTNDT